MTDAARAIVDIAGQPGTDLAPAALAIARLEYPSLAPEPWLAELDAMGERVRQRLAVETGEDAPLGAKLVELNRYLFEELGFEGNREWYADPRNSCLNQVIRRRSGIPITMAILYLEVARRAGLTGYGIGFPSHFLAGFVDAGTAPIVVDVFEGGVFLDMAGLVSLLRRHVGSGARLDPAMLAPASRRDVIVRMLHNLKHVYVRMRSFPQARTVADMLVTLEPESAAERRDRGLLAYQLEDFPGALRDLEAFVRMTEGASGDDDRDKAAAEAREHVKALGRRIAGFN